MWPISYCIPGPCLLFCCMHDKSNPPCNRKHIWTFEISSTAILDALCYSLAEHNKRPIIQLCKQWQRGIGITGQARNILNRHPANSPNMNTKSINTVMQPSRYVNNQTNPRHETHGNLSTSNARVTGCLHTSAFTML